MPAKRRALHAVGALALVAVVLAARWCYQHTRGVKIRVRSVDKQSLRSLAVRVTGAHYEVGDLAPGATTSVYVKPSGDSGVTFSFKMADGAKKSTRETGYFEPGNSGTITVDLSGTGATIIDEKIEFY